MDVIYTLTFLDNEGRTVIRKVGPFYEPIHFTRAVPARGRSAVEARTRPVGGGYYAVEFASHPTRAGRDLHPRAALPQQPPLRRPDQTRRPERSLAVWFNPMRWTLPIERSVVKLVLPVSLNPEVVRRHEDITPAIGRRTRSAHRPGDPPRAVPLGLRLRRVPERSGASRSTPRSANLPSEAVHMVKLYLPASALPKLASSGDVESLGRGHREPEGTGTT